LEKLASEGRLSAVEGHLAGQRAAEQGFLGMLGRREMLQLTVKIARERDLSE